MKKITFLLLLALVVVVVAACGSNQAQPTATAMPVLEPTATTAPTVEPTTEPAVEPAVDTADLSALTANPWQWVSFTEPLQQFEVEMPASYLLAFNEDGTLNIVADCNNAMGSYTDDAGSLTIEVGGMTRAACLPESRSDQFAQLLGGAARYFFEEGFLYIDLMADGGTMAFAVPSEPESAGDVTSYPWLWTSFTSPVEQFEVEAPENYAVTFSDDGTVNIKADCNNAQGSYTVDAGSLAIEVGPMTMAACPPESRSDQFVTLLGSAARYFFEDAQLYIDLLADGGTMLFAPEGEAEMAAAAASNIEEPAAIPVEDLMNATYSGIYDDPVTLTDGSYEDEPFTVQYLDGSELYTDLDGDGAEDAVVFLLERGGGTANIIYMAAQLNQAGQPVDAGAVRLDEVRVKSAAAGDGQIQLQVIAMGPGDGDCCPTHKAFKTYAFQDGQWVDISEEGELVQVSADDLNGTSWTLLELNYDTPVLADAGVTIDFADGQITGLGGCNNYRGSFSLGEDNPFVMTTSLVVSTKKACPEPILTQETAYLTALENVAQWGYEFSLLALYYLDEEGVPARLLFAPASDGEGGIGANPWQWASFTSPVEHFDVEAPENYVVVFSEDTSAALGASGTVNIKADCNNASGSYIVDAGSLKIEIGPMTLAPCPEGSRSDQFVVLLGGAARYFFEDGQLFIDLFADGGTMVFAPEGEAEMAEAQASASGLPPAEIADDEGGPAVVTGEMAYTYWYVSEYVKNPVVALMDLSRQIHGNYSEFIPRSGQVLGRLTSPFGPSPTSYRINLPVQPEGQFVDLDNDGQDDTGVRVFVVEVSNNLVGDSYLEQVEQLFFYNSYIRHPETGVMLEGDFLVWAPDDAQGFPGAAGEDGQWFTKDDPAVGLPAGYTLATLNRDGTATFDRSRQAVMDTRELAKWASPDLSDQGILESYNSLLDMLAERYAFTEERNLDWEQIRQTYLPRVEEADAAGDMAAYSVTLEDLALSIHDAHVGVKPALGQPGATTRYLRERNLNPGVAVAELSDSRFIVAALDPDGSGAEAGWQFGTEIVSVDGVPMAEYVDSLPLGGSAGTEETIRSMKMPYALTSSSDTPLEVAYRQPGESEIRTASVTPGAYSAFAVDPAPTEEISFRREGEFSYIQWNTFMRHIPHTLAVWQYFLELNHGAPGIIIDMRNNGGGSIELYLTMASFLFSADEPAALRWVDFYEYDGVTGSLALDYWGDYPISSPIPELTYDGPVVVLVNQNTVSAGEYFPQFLQTEGRAKVVGEIGTRGGGGNVEQVNMPGGIVFHFTKGRSTFAGTDELNLEGKGVTLDVRVPTTEESEQAKLDGRDPVLEAAVQVLAEEAAQRASALLTQVTWRWAAVLDTSLQPVLIEDPASYTLHLGEDGTVTVKADCNQASGEYVLGDDGALTITPGPTTLAACPEGSRSEAFLAYLAAAERVEISGGTLMIYLDPKSGAVGLVFEPVESAESATGEPSAGDLPADVVAQLDVWLNSQVYSEGGNAAGAAPGLVLLVETPEGRYLKAAGVSSLEEGTPMQVDDRLEIGSNTKSFTIVLLMQLQEEGVLSLDDKLSEWLPDLAAELPNGEEVTLYQLANHISGIPDYTGLIGLGLNDPEKLAQGYTPEELVQYAIDNAETEFAPGASWNYNNTGYILLGLVAEAATGKSLGELYQERIFDPLGLETAILVEGNPQEGELDSQGYFKGPSDGALVNSTQWNASQGWAAGAIAMTVEDLAAYAKGLAGGELFQDPDSLAQMLTFNEAAADTLASYGLGLLQVADGYWGHEGATPAFQTLWGINPDKGSLVVGMANSYEYSAGNFVNAINIIEGRGAQPYNGATFYQAGEVKPETFFTVWPWTQMTAGSTETEIDLGNFLSLRRDDVAILQSGTCGPIEGTFSATAPDAIAFDMDASGVTCPDGDPLMQLLGMLDTVASWHFENGGLVLVLDDGTELTFRSPY